MQPFSRNKERTTSDFLVIGGGVIGLNIALELKSRFKDCDIILIEKEPKCGRHSSSRNSGVLHAGFYYTADSLKAKFTRDGNRLLTEYCDSKKIPINKCGKLVIVQNEADLAGFRELQVRGEKNGVELALISEKEAREIEPRVRTLGRALFSPTTSTVNPGDVLLSLQRDALDRGIRIHCGTKYLKREEKNRVRTTAGKYEAGFVVNAAGLYADVVARDFDFSEQYRILPFKGLYLYSEEPPGAIRTNIYPVPDLKNPFLGVHFTTTVNGRHKIGPTAMPALWRENYSGLDGFSSKEFLEIISRQAGLFLGSDSNFKRLAVREVVRHFRSRMVSLATGLMEGVRLEDYRSWAPTGIRAQLLDIRKKKLEMDFLIEGDRNSIHVLNAVSPAFTCSIPFSRFVCDQIASS